MSYRLRPNRYIHTVTYLFCFSKCVTTTPMSGVHAITVKEALYLSPVHAMEWNQLYYCVSSTFFENKQQSYYHDSPVGINVGNVVGIYVGIDISNDVGIYVGIDVAMMSAMMSAMVILYITFY